MAGIQFDEKYGKMLEYTIVGEDRETPFIVARIMRRDKEIHIIHRLYEKDGQLTFGKGIGIPWEDDIAMDVCLAWQHMLLEDEL